MNVPDPSAHEDEIYPPEFLRNILATYRAIAMVGASPHWNRPSYFVMKYLQAKGFRVIPVNPAAMDAPILGERVYAGLFDIPEKIDIVDIFRRAEEVPAIVEDAIAVGAKVVWMQLGVRHPDAARRAGEAGLLAVQNRCLKIEYGRHSGELGWTGINSGIITNKRIKGLRR